MMKLNREELRDRIHACWIGKNIGGTIGTPFEGKQQINDIKGFTSPKGAALPNDDLDLQLVWLYAMESVGPWSLSSGALAEYWVNYIPPHWNEYGTGKSNLRGGLLPPLSGEYRNEKWKHSNGAWIRSEVWACLTPGYPDLASRYAFADATVDHGLGEGSYAEIFTVTLESLAFYETDIRHIIEQALARVPADCRLARSVSLVLAGFDAGDDWKTVRNRLVEDSRDLGWFQAPANVGFVVLGLLYGGGDFKRSVILAVNCGDDTDCTGATVGAFLGLLGGTKGIPADWAEYIGDGIVTVAVDRSCLSLARSCTELTERVMRLIPSCYLAGGVMMEYTDGASEWGTAGDSAAVVRGLFNRAALSYEVPSPVWLTARVEFDESPEIAPGQTVRARLVLVNRFPDPRHITLRVLFSDGFTAGNYRRNLLMSHQNPDGERWEIELTAGSSVEPINRIVVEIASDRPGVCYAPITLLG